MAHANNSIITGKLKGSVGKQLVFRDWQGKTVVAKAPKSRTGEPTEAQAETQEKFKMASVYAKAIIGNADQTLADAYRSVLKPRQNVYCRAMEDFLAAPEVKSIDTRDYKGKAGNNILVRAMDDFRVTAVRVEIYAADGTLLESGNAVQNINGLDWTYAATLDNDPYAGCTIKTIATDVPENQGTLEVIL